MLYLYIDAKRNQQHKILVNLNVFTEYENPFPYQGKLKFYTSIS